MGGDLTGTDRSNLDYLLLKIIDPSATVPQSNRMTLVRLHDGRILSGILDSGTESTLALRMPAETTVLDRESIAETKWLDVSLMPEGLLDGLADSDLRRLVLDSRGSDADYPRGYEVAVSDAGKRWSAPILGGVGKGPVIEMQLPPGTITQHIRITQTGEAENFWSIHQITLHGSRPQ